MDMLWNKKEDKGRLPDLPPLRHSFDRDLNAEEDTEVQEKQSLPAFPDSPTYNKFSQAAIKDAVKGDGAELPAFPDEDEKKRIVEMDEWEPEEETETPRMVPPPKYDVERERITTPVMAVQRGMPIQGGYSREIGVPDVFVKIDKFQAARKTFYDMKKKLEDIDELIKRIKEIKLREEQELESWEKDLMQVKSRIQEVTENIFEKVE